MKKYFKALMFTKIATFTLILLIYVGIGFTKANFDPYSWTENVRAGFAFFAISLFVLAFPIAGLVSTELE